jgi:hypothetical protein
MQDNARLPDMQVNARLSDEMLKRPEILAELAWSGVGCEVEVPVTNAAKKLLLQDSFGTVIAGECAGLMVRLENVSVSTHTANSFSIWNNRQKMIGCITWTGCS